MFQEVIEVRKQVLAGDMDDVITLGLEEIESAISAGQIELEGIKPEKITDVECYLDGEDVMCEIETLED